MGENTLQIPKEPHKIQPRPIGRFGALRGCQDLLRKWEKINPFHFYTDGDDDGFRMVRIVAPYFSAGLYGGVSLQHRLDCWMERGYFDPLYF